MALLRFWLTPPGGHIWSLIKPKLRTDILGAQVHHHIKPQLSRSNSKEMCHLTVKFRTLTSVTLKSRSNQKPVGYVMKPVQMYLQKKFGDSSYHRQPGNDRNMFLDNAPQWPHKGLNLKNEKNIRPILAKVPTHQVSSQLVQPLRNVPLLTGRRRRTTDKWLLLKLTRELKIRASCLHMKREGRRKAERRKDRGCIHSSSYWDRKRWTNGTDLSLAARGLRFDTDLSELRGQEKGSLSLPL